MRRGDKAEDTCAALSPGHWEVLADLFGGAGG